MQARQITFFLAVVEHGGFGRAAAALRVAQPTLSQSIRSLERDLGADLFHRAADGVVLTTAGRALLGPARQLVRDLGHGPRVGGRPVTRPGAGPHRGRAAGHLPGRGTAAVVSGWPVPTSRCAWTAPRPTTNLQVLVREGDHEVGLTYLPVPRLGLTEIELGWPRAAAGLPALAAPRPGPGASCATWPASG